MDESIRSALRIKTFDGQGFPVWKFQVKTLIELSGLLGVVEGTVRKSSQPDQQVEWDEKDAKARGILVTSMDSSQLVHLMSCKTAEEMWTRLESIHQQKSAASKSILTGQFYTFKMDSGKEIAANVADLESLVAQLEAVGWKVKDEDFIAKVISSLPSSFRHFISA